MWKTQNYKRDPLQTPCGRPKKKLLWRRKDLLSLNSEESKVHNFKITWTWKNNFLRYWNSTNFECRKSLASDTSCISSQQTFTCSKSATETLKKVVQSCPNICSKLTIKTLKWRRRRRCGIFIVNIEHVLLLFSSVPIVNFEHAFVYWDNLL